VHHESPVRVERFERRAQGMDTTFEVAVQILLVAAVVRLSDNFPSTHAFKV
jgi:hypothetical protein